MKSDAFLKAMHTQLLERKDEITRIISNGSSTELGDKQVKDIGDEALSSSMNKIQDSLQKAEIDELNLIEQAVSRINKGEYGICVECQEAISDKRLEYYPYAARCIICQENQESQ